MKSLLLVLSCINFLACSSIHQVKTKDPSNNELIRKFNDYAQNRTAKIVQIDGQEKKGKNLRVSSEKLNWEDVNGEHELIIDSIYKVQFVDRGKGAVRGVRNGLVIGLVYGIVGGLIEAESKKGTELEWESPVPLVLITGILGGIGGTVTGLIVGAILGYSETYMFSETAVDIYHVTLDDVKILKETEGEIKIEWKGQNVWLFKSQIDMTKKDGKVSIPLKKDLYQKKFRK